MEPRNRCQGINSASLCSLAGRYDSYSVPSPHRFFKNSSSGGIGSLESILVLLKNSKFWALKAGTIRVQQGFENFSELITVLLETSKSFKLDILYKKVLQKCKNHQRSYRKCWSYFKDLETKIFISWHNPFKGASGRARIFKRLWNLRIDSKEWIPPACSLAGR